MKATTATPHAPKPPPAPRRWAGTPAQQAIPALIDLYAPRLHALAHRLCGRRDEADDIVQDTFLQALRKWDTFRGEADPGTWLYTIAARACRKKLRARSTRARRERPATDLMPWSETTVMELAAAPRGEEDPAERAEAIHTVQAHVARLPEHLRLPLVLKDMLELPVDDVAHVLDLSQNTVKTRLHRARLALRKAMTAKAAPVHAPQPLYEKQVCLDLLKAKLDAMDRGGAAAGLRVPQAEVCARCRAVFRELDLVQDACAQMAAGQFPPALRQKILTAIHARDTASPQPKRPGRRPVKASQRRKPAP